MYDIGIVIVNYNVRHFLVQCLNSIQNSSLGDLNIEIWVVDNASVDGAAQLIHQDFPDVNVIVNERNLGFSKANNIGIKNMHSKYVLLLNPDTILQEDTLAKCFDYMESHSDVGALGVRMIDGAGNFLPESKRKIPDLWNSFCKLTYLSKIFPKSKWFSGYNLGYLPENETAEIEVLCGAFMFIPKKVLEKTGLLDEAFFMYGEDIDLSYRILKEGYKIIYFPETTIIHFKGESTKKSSLNYVKTFYGAMTIYVNKHYSAGNARYFSFFILLAIQIRAFFSILNRVFRQLIKMVLDYCAIWGLLNLIKYYWAATYFDDIDYYEGTAIYLNISIYAAIWVISLWFFGRYDKVNTKINRIVTGVFIGIILILLVYALESVQFRTSRAIILLGSIAVLIYTVISHLIFQFIQNRNKKNEQKERSILIVAQKPQAESIKEHLNLGDIDLQKIYVVCPNEENIDAYYVNNIGKLGEVVKHLHPDEIIFSSEDISMKKIIHYMTQIGEKANFKIAGDESLGIIGQKAKGYGDNMYSLSFKYPLEDMVQRRLKIMLDMLVCCIFIIFFPLIWILNLLSIQFIKNLFLVIIQKKTWVGYGGELEDFQFLPSLPKAVVGYPLSFQYFIYEDGFFKEQNLYYARNYSIWMDIEVIFKNLTNFSQK